MVKVKPVVFSKFALYDFGIINLVVGNFGVCQCQSHGIVPGLRNRWRINCNLWCFFQLYCILIDRWSRNVVENGIFLCIGNNLVRHISQNALALSLRREADYETSATVIKQPPRLKSLLQRPIGKSVGLQMVGLRIVHRNEHIGAIP